MIFNILVAILFTYYTFYATQLFKKKNREEVKTTNTTLNDFRRIPIKTINEQKQFLDIKRPFVKYKYDKEFWKTFIYQAIMYFIFITVWMQIFIAAKIEWQLWQTILLFICIPLFVNVFLERFNLQKDDLLAIIRGSNKNDNNRPKAK